ncbi:MAG: flippase-like domain-containing protein [Bacteroidaceae bacterium]|nr:flippase-like domain-containing protein [Bacteroidaceae bacterium]
MKDALKKTARWLVPLIIAAAILIYMYHDFDFRTVWQILTEETNVWWLFVSLIPILVSHILRGVRWLLTLEPIGYRPRTINSILSIYVAYASNIVIPRVGEISRCGVLAKYDGIPFSKSLGTLVAERIVDFIIAFSFCSIMLIFQFDKLYAFFDKTGTGEGGVVQIFKNPWFYVVLALIAGVIILSWRLIHRSKNKTAGSVARTLDNFVEGFVSLKNVKRLWLFVLYTVLIWLCYYLEFYLCFYCFPFTETLGPAAGAVIFAAISVAIIIPTPNGAGPWHFVVITLLGMYGVLEAQAGSFALIVHTFQTVFVLLFGLTAWILLQIINRKTS